MKPCWSIPIALVLPLRVSATDTQVEARVAILTKRGDDTLGLVADSPAKTIFSQQTNALAVLDDAVPKDRQKGILRRIMGAASNAPASPPLIPATYYFDYYVARALEHAQIGDEYFALLERWRALLKLHFTTWPETPENPRSDSHAWSLDPTIDLLRMVAA